MRPPQVNYGWNPIESAPFDEDIALRVTDGRGGPYTLRWPCRRTASGWINSRKGTPLEVTPVRWRPYPIPPSRLRAHLDQAQGTLRLYRHDAADHRGRAEGDYGLAFGDPADGDREEVANAKTALRCYRPRARAVPSG
jgi:hypothetical protein